MLIELPLGWIVALNVLGWPVLQLTLAWLFTLMPEGWFHPPQALPWGKGERAYERWFHVKRWKTWLPDGARWFGSGFAKASLASADPDYLQRFVRETYRGELCHWCALGCAPVFFLWNPWWADLIMIGYAAAANVPCIVAQRYNRLRFQRLLARRRMRLRACIPESQAN